MATQKKSPQKTAAKKTAVKKAPAKKAAVKKQPAKKAVAKKAAQSKKQEPIATIDDFVDRAELAKLATKAQAVLSDAQKNAEAVADEAKFVISNAIKTVEKKTSFWRKIFGLKAK